MEASLQQRLEKLLNAYSHHYDIRRGEEVEGGSSPPRPSFTCGMKTAC